MLGDQRGSVNPTRSKVRQDAFEGGPPEHPGRPHEDGGNAVPRWMVATEACVQAPGQDPAYSPARPHRESTIDDEDDEHG